MSTATATVEPEPTTPVTRLRSYPTAVVTPTGQVYGSALVHVTERRVYVWTSVPAGGDPLDRSGLAYVADLEPDQDVPRRMPISVRDTVDLLVGPTQTVILSRARGCGCHPLGRWKPFAPDLSR